MRDSRSWQPPPRPPELKDVHVVNAKSDNTDHIDYFALIREKPRPPGSPAPVNKQNTSAQQKAKISVAKLPFSQPTQPMPPGIESKIFGNPVVKLITHNKKKLAVAAAISFVSYASWSIVHTLSANRSRDPAAAANAAPVALTEKPKTPAPENSSKLGQGSPKAAAPIAPRHDYVAPNVSTSVQHTSEDNRGPAEAPQFYSSSEAAPPPPETPAEAMNDAMNNYNNGNPTPYPQQGYDPNSGAVNPPTLIQNPPPGSDNGSNF